MHEHARLRKGVQLVNQIESFLALGSERTQRDVITRGPIAGSTMQNNSFICNSRWFKYKLV